MSPQPLIRIGARGSKLSLAQSRMMQQRIAAALGASPDEAEAVAPLTVITTTGDRIQDRRLLELGGKALFTKEIEEALADGRIDCAVHSLKDVPAQLPEGLCIAAIPAREDPRDALIVASGLGKVASLDDLPPNARLGTASLRRQAQALHRRPDLAVSMMRGNVDTRLAKLAAGDADAIFLANALQIPDEAVLGEGLHFSGQPPWLQQELLEREQRLAFSPQSIRTAQAASAGGASVSVHATAAQASRAGSRERCGAAAAGARRPSRSFTCP